MDCEFSRLASQSRVDFGTYSQIRKNRVLRDLSSQLQERASFNSRPEKKPSCERDGEKGQKSIRARSVTVTGINYLWLERKEKR